MITYLQIRNIGVVFRYSLEILESAYNSDILVDFLDLCEGRCTEYYAWDNVALLYLAREIQKLS